jgi:trehalose utilization protein
MSGDAVIRATVWGENIHEHQLDEVRQVYPDGMHNSIASGIAQHLGADVKVRVATFDQPEHGLTPDVLADTDVLTWWGHVAHDRVDDAVVERIHEHVLAGMGLIVLHSAHVSKIFRRLMGTTCSLRWREAGDREIVWTVNPGHPIAQGLPPGFVVPKQEMYGEYFDIPQPDEMIFISSFSGGEVFRSGCCFTRGLGRIFYFSPGHETYPVYHQSEIQRVLANAVRWANRSEARRPAPCDNANAPTGWFKREQTTT